MDVKNYAVEGVNRFLSYLFKQNGTKKFWDFMRTHDRQTGGGSAGRLGVSITPQEEVQVWRLCAVHYLAKGRDQEVLPRALRVTAQQLWLHPSPGHRSSQRWSQSWASGLQEPRGLFWLSGWSRQLWRQELFVSILIFNTSRQCFVVVKQFRPVPLTQSNIYFQEVKNEMRIRCILIERNDKRTNGSHSSCSL
ncbi:hypothetical protein EK904_008802 [Melospiza melodia maxima]|nr:hypothetical protein EK904_008802 [Melospiza melodia maxima]